MESGLRDFGVKNEVSLEVPLVLGLEKHLLGLMASGSSPKVSGFGRTSGDFNWFDRAGRTGGDLRVSNAEDSGSIGWRFAPVMQVTSLVLI